MENNNVIIITKGKTTYKVDKESDLVLSYFPIGEEDKAKTPDSQMTFESIYGKKAIDSMKKVVIVKKQQQGESGGYVGTGKPNYIKSQGNKFNNKKPFNKNFNKGNKKPFNKNKPNGKQNTNKKPFYRVSYNNMTTFNEDSYLGYFAVKEKIMKDMNLPIKNGKVVFMFNDLLKKENFMMDEKTEVYMVKSNELLYIKVVDSNNSINQYRNPFLSPELVHNMILKMITMADVVVLPIDNEITTALVKDPSLKIQFVIPSDSFKETYLETLDKDMNSFISKYYDVFINRIRDIIKDCPHIDLIEVDSFDIKL